MEIGIYLLYFGLILLSLSMKKHYEAILNKELNKRLKNIFLFFGYVSLTFSLLILMNFFGISIGLVFWFGICGVLIVFIALLISYKPKWILISLLVFSLINIALIFK